MARICILCESWESGGIESFLCNTLLAMDRSGLEVDIVAAQLRDSVFTAPLEAAGIHFRELSGTLRSPKNGRLFSALLAQRHYDVVHLNAYQGLSLHYLALAQKAGVPVRIAHSHNTELRKSPARPLKLALHRWARRAYWDVMTHRWACSTPAARFLFGDTSEWTFIPNGIDVERFRFDPVVREQTRAELGLDGKLVIGNVGRLCYQKNQVFLLEVFREVQRQRPESVLLLVGEGEDQPALEERTRVLGLERNVIFYGTTHRVERLYWAMDGFAMPSLFEGLPVTGVEAQCAGLPCLFSCGITKECALTSRAAFLPLEEGPEYWGTQILSMAAIGDRRAEVFAAMAEFDINAVAAQIKEAWVG